MAKARLYLFGALILGVASLGGFAITTFAQTVVFSNGVIYQAGMTYPDIKESNPGWTANQYTCGSGSTLVGYHYDDGGSSNDTNWYACVNNTSNSTSYGVGALTQGGITNIYSKESNPGWLNNQFTCDSGYTLQEFHYDSGSSNNATWMSCIIASQAQNNLPGSGGPPPATGGGGGGGGNGGGGSKGVGGGGGAYLPD